jgi:hypothetical protein
MNINNDLEAVMNLSEEEILIRAREAYITENGHLSEDGKSNVRGGSLDNDGGLRIAIAVRALRDLYKPLSEIQPVDPDREEAMRLARATGWMSEAINEPGSGAALALAAIKRGRELERGAA